MNERLTKIVAVLACGLVVALVPAAASAQATGQITGVITDTSGSVVPGATVEVTNQATGFTRNAVTELDGVYTIPLLNPGVYEAKASLSGFRTTVRGGIEVVVNGTARVDLKLQVGAIAEQVTVAASAPLVETKNATLGVVIDRKKVVDLPLNGRNFTQLGTLFPAWWRRRAASGAATAPPRPEASATRPAASTSTACGTSRTTSSSTGRRTTTRSTPASCCGRRPTRSRSSRS